MSSNAMSNNPPNPSANNPSANNVPAPVSFQQAIALTQALASRMEQGTVSDAEITQTIADLVQTIDGARGFFVGYLSGDSAVADQPTAPVVQALRTSPQVVADLLVKNLAMSTATAMTHRRNQNSDMAAGSDRVQSRTAKLIQQLQLPEIQQKAIQLRDSAAGRDGVYQDFLQRWGYDTEQKAEIRAAIDRVMG